MSNLQGREIVASMVVFGRAPSPVISPTSEVGVRNLAGQDDFASLAQVVGRRFARLEAGSGDASFGALPNLVVIDGGKGQLAAALAAIKATPTLARVAVVALAKREELVFVPGRSQPIRLDAHDPGLQLLQRIRNKAHRFAVTFHRQRRDARSLESILDTLPGIGPARHAGDPPAVRLDGGIRRGDAGGARDRSRASPEDGACRLCPPPSNGRLNWSRARPLLAAVRRCARRACAELSADAAALNRSLRHGPRRSR